MFVNIELSIDQGKDPENTNKYHVWWLVGYCFGQEEVRSAWYCGNGCLKDARLPAVDEFNGKRTVKHW